MSKAVCSSCIRDTFLKKIVDSEGSRSRCDHCGEDQSHTITITRLGELVAVVINENFVIGSEGPSISKYSDEVHWEREGDDLESIVRKVLDQSFDFDGEIVSAVLATQTYDAGSGKEAFLDEDLKYVRVYLTGAGLEDKWDTLQHELMTARRFFSEAARDFFNELFEDVEGILINSLVPEEQRAVINLHAGRLMYRGRVCNSESMTQMFDDPYLHVGPPPPARTRAGRMNPEGISIFYGALDEQTCLAELRPALAGKAAVISLKTTNSLRMLDFTVMTRAYKPLSYFQPDFDRQSAKYSFIRRLAKLISRPIVPGHENEYLITQTMMEYLGHVHSPPFDGVFFPSSQQEDGINVVLFPQVSRSRPSFPLTYVADSLKIYETTEIRYTHKRHSRNLGDMVRQVFEGP